MAPTKSSKSNLITLGINNISRTISTRSQNQQSNINLKLAANVRGKRKADGSPLKEHAVKRSAFGDITNAIVKQVDNGKKIATVPIKKVVIQSKVLPTLKTVVATKQNVKNVENVPPPQEQPRVNKILTRAALRGPVVAATTAIKPKVTSKEKAKQTARRISNEFEKTEDSLYSSALEDLSLDTTAIKTEDKDRNSKKSDTEVIISQIHSDVPEGVNDFDKENWLDTYQVSEYAMDIFNYLKTREPLFRISHYMERQSTLSCWMRSLLIDWMVEVQESFELNHETLYLAVKLVDLYLSKVPIQKEMLQLLGAATLFISAKFDERIPPQVEDFLYICDGAYEKRELLRMEIAVLKNINFDLGIPLSYRFLRRYARCAKVSMPTLTLARYILEYSLMDYETIMFSDSKMAAAVLYLALRMKNISGWTKTLEYYTGFTLSDIKQIVVVLNTGLQRRPKDALSTVRNKYTHRIFFEVAKVPVLANDQLQLPL